MPLFGSHPLPGGSIAKELRVAGQPAGGGTHGVQQCQGDPGHPCWRELQRLHRRRFPWDLASTNGDCSIFFMGFNIGKW